MDVHAYDPELVAIINSTGVDLPPPLEPDGISARRAFAKRHPRVDELLAGRSIRQQQVVVAQRRVPVDIFRSGLESARAPAVFFLHGGGMIGGDRHTGISQVLDWVERYGIVAITPEYRLAPEHPDPEPIDDCYAALEWVATHASEYGVETSRLLVMGASAGGGLAAGIALACRDRSGPRLAGQVLGCPMLDDNNDSPSTLRFADAPVWPRVSNNTAWTALLGDRRATDRVSPYAAPARARDLSHLPTAFIDVGSAEIFRDEAVAYASSLWNAGTEAELHVWAGGFHNFEGYAPTACLTKSAQAARENWVVRTLGLRLRTP